MKKGTEPAFPCFEHNENGIGNCISVSIGGEKQYIPFTKGMSTRQLIAKDVMCAMIGNSNANRVYEEDNNLIKETLRLTDLLIQQEEESR